MKKQDAGMNLPNLRSHSLDKLRQIITTGAFSGFSACMQGSLAQQAGSGADPGITSRWPRTHASAGALDFLRAR
jgi:hypothetical protein